MQAYQITYHGDINIERWERFIQYLKTAETIRNMNIITGEKINGGIVHRVAFYMEQDYIHDEDNESISFEEFMKLAYGKEVKNGKQKSRKGQKSV